MINFTEEYGVSPDIAGLEVLRDHMTIVPDKAFDMGCWSNSKESLNSHGDRVMIYLSQAAHDNMYKCDMAGCLAGHATIVFPERLKLVKGDLHTTDGEHSAEYAFGVAFGLPYDIASWMTAGSANHRTVESVVRMLTEFIDGYKAGTLDWNDWNTSGNPHDADIEDEEDEAADEDEYEYEEEE